LIARVSSRWDSDDEKLLETFSVSFYYQIPERFLELASLNSIRNIEIVRVREQPSGAPSIEADIRSKETTSWEGSNIS
jgi:hypothetical protein